MSATRTWSLSSWLAGLMAAVVAGSMGAYAVWEYVTTPATTAGDLLVRHGWHVLALGAVVYGATWLASRRLLVRPIRAIVAHLYGVGTGVVDPISHNSRVREIEGLVSGVNLMVQRMRQAQDEGTVDTIQEDLFALRRLARQVHEAEPHRAALILEHVTRLQAAMSTMLQRAA